MTSSAVLAELLVRNPKMVVSSINLISLNADFQCELIARKIIAKYVELTDKNVPALNARPAHQKSPILAKKAAAT
jgi:hypothetical protein